MLASYGYNTGLAKVKAEEMLEAMKEAVNFRTKRVRRTQTPF